MFLLYSGVAGYMQFIPHARVPVLQYVSNRFGISCDISIDNNAGQIKSKIFYWVNSLDERFGDMVLLVRSSWQSDPFVVVLTPPDFISEFSVSPFIADQRVGKSSKY